MMTYKHPGQNLKASEINQLFKLANQGVPSNKNFHGTSNGAVTWQNDPEFKHKTENPDCFLQIDIKPAPVLESRDATEPENLTAIAEYAFIQLAPTVQKTKSLLVVDQKPIDYFAMIYSKDHSLDCKLTDEIIQVNGSSNCYNGIVNTGIKDFNDIYGLFYSISSDSANSGESDYLNAFVVTDDPNAQDLSTQIQTILSESGQIVERKRILLAGKTEAGADPSGEQTQTLVQCHLGDLEIGTENNLSVDSQIGVLSSESLDQKLFGNGNYLQLHDFDKNETVETLSSDQLLVRRDGELKYINASSLSNVISGGGSSFKPDSETAFHQYSLQKFPGTSDTYQLYNFHNSESDGDITAKLQFGQETYLNPLSNQILIKKVDIDSEGVVQDRTLQYKQIKIKCPAISDDADFQNWKDAVNSGIHILSGNQSHFWIKGGAAYDNNGKSIGDESGTIVIDLNGKELIGNWKCTGNFEVNGTFSTTDLEVDNLTATNAEITNLTVDQENVTNLTATDIECVNLTATNLTGDTANLTTLTANTLYSDQIEASNGHFSTELTASNLTATNAECTSLTANMLTCDSLTANNCLQVDSSGVHIIGTTLDCDGQMGLKIGNTTLSETQLADLLALIGTGPDSYTSRIDNM